VFLNLRENPQRDQVARRDQGPGDEARAKRVRLWTHGPDLPDYATYQTKTDRRSGLVLERSVRSTGPGPGVGTPGRLTASRPGDRSGYPFTADELASAATISTRSICAQHLIDRLVHARDLVEPPRSFGTRPRRLRRQVVPVNSFLPWTAHPAPRPCEAELARGRVAQPAHDVRAGAHRTRDDPDSPAPADRALAGTSSSSPSVGLLRHVVVMAGDGPRRSSRGAPNPGAPSLVERHHHAG